MSVRSGGPRERLIVTGYTISIGTVLIAIMMVLYSGDFTLAGRFEEPVAAYLVLAGGVAFGITLSYRVWTLPEGSL